MRAAAKRLHGITGTIGGGIMRKLLFAGTALATFGLVAAGLAQTGGNPVGRTPPAGTTGQIVTPPGGGSGGGPTGATGTNQRTMSTEKTTTGGVSSPSSSESSASGTSESSGSTSQPMGVAQQLNAQDETFVHAAAIGGLSEVEAGKLAEQKAQRADVKQFGQRMVQDHSKANDQLMAVAKEAGVTPPTTLDSTHQATQAQLEKLSGADFDRSYVPVQVSDHIETVQLFKQEAETGGDADLKKFAADTLPTLQEHLEMAQHLERELQSETPQASASHTPQPQSGSSTPPQDSSGSGSSQ
ncbi:MAG: DUF4142 domain-containing protein [Alphaproteobacteria bacterium]|nr:DUF4142 domain-containing protein [Alphaproteobacteria bacterium]